MTPKKVAGKPGVRIDEEQAIMGWWLARSSKKPSEFEKYCAGVVDDALLTLAMRGYDVAVFEELMIHRNRVGNLRRFGLCHVLAGDGTEEGAKLHDLARLAWYALRITVRETARRLPAFAGDTVEISLSA